MHHACAHTIDALEARLLLAGTVALSHHTLTISGTNSFDVISLHAAAGKFSVHGFRGAVAISQVKKIVIYGRDGNDNISLLDRSIRGLAMPITIYGGRGIDLIYGSKAAETIYGDAGNDRIYGSEGNNSLFGDDGDDYLAGFDHDLLIGGNGNDHISAPFGNADISGGPGNDSLEGGLAPSTISGEDGNDTIVG